MGRNEVGRDHTCSSAANLERSIRRQARCELTREVPHLPTPRTSTQRVSHFQFHDLTASMAESVYLLPSATLLIRAQTSDGDL